MNNNKDLAYKAPLFIDVGHSAKQCKTPLSPLFYRLSFLHLYISLHISIFYIFHIILYGIRANYFLHISLVWLVSLYVREMC